MQAKLEELKKSRELRKDGLSIREISKILKVSKGSVSMWVRDVEVPEDRKLELIKKGGAIYKFANLRGELNKEKYRILREGYQDEGRVLARSNDPIFFAGCMLYWAEGTKSRGRVQFTNSDVNMLKFFLSFLMKYFKIKYDGISITCQYYCSNGLSNTEVEKYWISSLGFPESCIRKTLVNKLERTSSKERQERTKYGVVKIIVHDVRVIQMIYGAIQEIVGFNNDEWLNSKF